MVAVSSDKPLVHTTIAPVPVTGSHRRGSSLCAEFVLALIHSPSTMAELKRCCGIEHNKQYLDKYVKDFRTYGLVYIKEWRSRTSPVYAWAGEPFSCADAPAP